MQGLVEHYSSKGWLQRVEQCVLHMDISSLDFNQVIICALVFLVAFLLSFFLFYHKIFINLPYLYCRLSFYVGSMVCMVLWCICSTKD